MRYGRFGLVFFTFATIALLVGVGCGFPLYVGKSDPEPNIDMERSALPLKLEFDEKVRDSFSTDGDSGMSGLSVHDWRATLEAGFRNGFGPFFELDSPEPGLRLVIVKADLRGIPAAVAYGGGAVAGRTQIRYAARLLDADGTVLRRATGTVQALGATSDRMGFSDNAGDAVALMYEAIASQLFGEAPRAEAL